MIITTEDLNFLIEKLTCDEVRVGVATMVFVAANCDAIWAYRILIELFKQNNIQYKSVPVFSYDDIEINIDKDTFITEVKSLVFLNCGAKTDFSKCWFVEEDTDIKTFLFESQRPIVHNNIHTQKAVYVVTDGDILINDVPEDEDYLEQEEDLESCVDGEKEYQMIINGGKAPEIQDKEQESKHEDEQDSKHDDERDSKQDDEPEGENDFDTDLIGKKRKRSLDGNESSQSNSRQMKLNRLENYYWGTNYSKPWSYLLYWLISQQNRQTVETFWLWVLGLTDQLVHSKIAFYQYDEWFVDCQRELLTITNQIIDQENDSALNNRIEEQAATDDIQKLLYSKVDLDNENTKVGSILPQQELKLMFLRSWTLYDSFHYSNYVVSKFRIWTELGKRNLYKFFATLGIPIEQWQQQYKFMDLKYKTILNKNIAEVASEFDLQNLLFSSFIRQLDWKTQINASDMVYIITSLLESPQPVMTHNKKADEESEENKDNDDTSDLEKAFDSKIDMRIENFWAAVDALGIKNKEHIGYGIDLAKKLQKALVDTASSLINNKRVKPSSKFRYVIIENDDLLETKMFQYPLAIQKLALFLMEAYKEIRGVTENMPVVISVKNSARDSYLVAGVLGQNSAITGTKNEFGNCFASVAEEIGANFKQNGFETWLIELEKEKHEEFLDRILEY